VGRKTNPPGKWVTESTAVHVEKTDQPEGSYGYMWWIDPAKNIFKALDGADRVFMFYLERIL